MPTRIELTVDQAVIDDSKALTHGTTNKLALQQAMIEFRDKVANITGEKKEDIHLNVATEGGFTVKDFGIEHMLTDRCLPRNIRGSRVLVIFDKEQRSEALVDYAVIEGNNARLNLFLREQCVFGKYKFSIVQWDRHTGGWWAIVGPASETESHSIEGVSLL